MKINDVHRLSHILILSQCIASIAVGNAENSIIHSLFNTFLIHNYICTRSKKIKYIQLENIYQPNNVSNLARHVQWITIANTEYLSHLIAPQYTTG